MVRSLPDRRSRIVLALLVPVAAALILLVLWDDRPSVGAGISRQADGVTARTPLAGERAPVEMRQTEREMASVTGTIVAEPTEALDGAGVVLVASGTIRERGYMGLFLSLLEEGMDQLEARLDRRFVSPPVCARGTVSATGAFTIRDVAPGAYELELRHELYRLRRRPVVVISGTQSRDLGTLRAEAAGSLLVRVVDPVGRPVADAELELAHGLDGVDYDDERFWSDLGGVYRLFSPQKARTDRNGEHVFERLLGNRTWHLSVAHDGWVPVRDTVVVEVGARQSHLVRLRPAAVLTVRVIDEAGKPIPDAKVRVTLPGATEPPPLVFETDVRGVGRCDRLTPGSVVVRVEHRDFLPYEKQHFYERGRPHELEVTLARGLSVAGRVLDQDGEPIAGAWVSRLRDYAQTILGFDVVSFAGEDLIGMAVRRGAVRTDQDGRFVVSGIAKDAKVNLMVGADGFVQARLGPVDPGATGLELRLVPTATVTGVVVTAEDGRAIADFEAECTRVSWFVFDRPFGHVDVRGSGDGRFEIAGLPQGRFTLRVAAEGRAALERSITIDGSRLDVGEIRLAPPARVAGVTLGPDGEPLPGARVWVAKGGMGDSSFVRAIAGRPVVDSDDEGRFRIAVPARRVRLMAEKHGYATTRSRSVRVKPGETVEGFEITIGRGGSLLGVVVDIEGHPLAGWNIQTTANNSMSIRFTRSDANGEFRVLGLPPGQYLVDGFPDRVTAPAWMRRADESSIADMIAETTDNMIRKRVTIHDGQPSHLRLVWEGRDEARSLVDLDGFVRVGAKPLTAGVLELVELGGGGRTRYAEISAGRFTVPRLSPGAYQARVKPGLLARYLGAPKVVHAVRSGQEPVELDYPGGRLSGVVVYGDGGRPAGGALVTVYGRESLGRDNALGDATFGDDVGVTDEHGRFAIDGLPPGRYRLLAREMNLAGTGTASGSGRLEDLVLSAGQARDNLKLELGAGATLSVSVRDRAGPRAGALVRVLAGNGRPVALVPRATTDDRGEVVFRSVPPGSYRVAVDATGAAPLLSKTVALAAGKEATLYLTLRGGVAVALEVGAAKNEVRADERVAYSLWDSGGALIRAGVMRGLVPAPGGDRLHERVEVGPLDPGRVLVRVEGASFGVIERRLEVPATGPTTWRIELRR